MPYTYIDIHIYTGASWHTQGLTLLKRGRLAPATCARRVRLAHASCPRVGRLARVCGRVGFKQGASRAVLCASRLRLCATRAQFVRDSLRFVRDSRTRRAWDDRVFSPFFRGGFPPFSICVRYVLVCSNIFIICVYQPSIWWRNPQKVLCKESYCYGRYAVRYALIYFDIYWAKYQHIHRYAPSRKHQAALYVCVHIVFILVESSI